MRALSKQIGTAGVGRLAGLAKVKPMRGRDVSSAVAKKLSLENRNYA
jgi:hypothetical protein